jgi:predicted membrane protein
MPDNFDKQRWEEVPDVPARQLARRRWRQGPLAPRLLFAIFLIAAGTHLFLSNLGLLPEFNIWAFWPLIFVVGGVGKLASDTNSAGRALGVILIAFGAVMTLITLGILHIRAHDDSWVFSLLLIAFGSLALIKVLERRDYTRPQVGFPQQAVSSGNIVKEQVVFGSVKRKVDSNDFQGGKLESVFGSIDLNLRRAQISSPERSATIEVNAVFGSIELRVPETWRVVTHAAGIFGSIEDKTLANKVAGFDGPTLFITGSAVFGSVEIKD